MLKLGKREKNWILIVGGIICIYILFAIVLKPLVDKVKQLRREIKLTEVKLKEGLIVQVRKDRIRKEYDRYQIYLKQENRSEQEIIGNFLKELEKLAQESRLSVISLSPSENTQSENRKVYNADFRAEGNIKGILNFFSNVQKSRLLMKIDKFTVASKDKRSVNLKLNAKISTVIP